MKTNIKYLGLGAVLMSLTAGCTDQELDQYIVEKPEELAQYDYLLAYGNLKDYAHGTRADINPDFVMAGACTLTNISNIRQCTGSPTPTSTPSPPAMQ